MLLRRVSGVSILYNIREERRAKRRRRLDHYSIGKVFKLQEFDNEHSSLMCPTDRGKNDPTVDGNRTESTNGLESSNNRDGKEAYVAQY
jgi:hypothetical protein